MNCEHYDWTSCKCNIGKMRLFSIRNGFIKCDKKRSGAMPCLEITTDAHGVTNDDYVFADKIHAAKRQIKSKTVKTKKITSQSAD